MLEDERKIDCATTTRFIDWHLATFLTAIAVCGAAVLARNAQLAVFAAVLLVIVCWATRSIRPASNLARYSALFALPLLVIHGVLNPEFPVDYFVAKIIGVRLAGIDHAFNATLRISLLFMPAIAWINIDKDEFVSALINMSAPMPLLFVGTFAASIAEQMGRRIKRIYMAQQARGIDVTSNIFVRFAALPRILIPLFVSTISDTELRSTTLALGGIGVTYPVPWSAKPTPATTFVLEAACLIAFGLTVFAV